jgi:heat shock protein HslJ
MRRLGLVLILSIGFVSACDESPISPSAILGESWRLTSLQQGTSPPVVVGGDRSYAVRFGDDGRVAVKSDCNSCGGSYTLSGSTLTFGPLACTRVFCGQESLDSSFVGALQGARAASMSDEALVVEGDGAILRFSR